MRWITAIPSFLFQLLFGCRHERLTRPFTLDQQTYKVCLACGSHVYYSVEDMRPMTSAEVLRMQMARTGGGKVLPLTARVRGFVRMRPKCRAAA